MRSLSIDSWCRAWRVMLPAALSLGVIAGCGKITLAPGGEDMSVVVDTDMAAFFGDMAGTDGPSGPLLPAIRVNTDLVGFPTKLDATASVDRMSRTISYSWHFTQVPPGSHVADSCAPTGGFATCLSSATDPMPSFEPDLGGMYQIELTIMAGSDTAQLGMGFTVPTQPLFVSYGHMSTTADTAITMVRSDGTGAKDSNCRSAADGGFASINNNNNKASAILFGWLFDGILGLGTVAPSGGGVNGFVYLSLGLDSSGNATGGALFAGDDTSSCNTNAAVRVDPPDGGPAGYIPAFPVFSPDGKRILYMEIPPGNFGSGSPVLVSVGADGSNYHVISTSPQLFVFSRPIWLDNGTVAWVENNGTNSGSPAMPQFVINSHADVAGGPFSGSGVTLIDCSGPPAVLTTIEGMAVSSLAPLTLVVAGSKDAFTDESDPGPQTIDLYRLTNPSSSHCHLDNLTNNKTRRWSRDFVLTPDGKNAYYASTAGNELDGSSAGEFTDIWTVPVDGSKPAAYFAGDPSLNDFGPHFIAGGRQLVWTQTIINGGSFLIPDGGFKGGGLMISNIDGTHQRSLLRESGNLDAATGVMGGLNLGGVSCSVVGDALGDALRALFGGAAAALLLTVLVMMRRRRRA